MFSIYQKLLILILFCTLTGCSNTFVQIGGMFKESVIGLPDDDITAVDIEKSPYASIHVKINNAHRSYVLLAFAEAPQTLPATNFNPQNMELKWVSSDFGMLVTRNGRLLKTLNLFDGNLLEINSKQPDPLALGLHLNSTPLHWQSTIDWQPGYHINYEQRSTFSFVADETVIINDKPLNLKKFNEHIVIPDLDLEYDNQFWVDAANGNVMKSYQKIAPNLPFIEITLLKPYGFKDVK
ncbi:hypothetical protein GCM10009347_21780 [Shewanella algicola]|uniref:YjbF family lipoprotein n=1 Tax=Shewanella algicola TaxID=640633 RepID=A0A9X1Z701_9GAMM|nr:YjbF family lipoprotein [Shewanella algicola]MCL1104672.1 YjbF family lipoprotein [Shewanella algicola]GGP54591.1 hypothetical protein GCM10009347_21780 [Shewanella algicola]